MIVFVDIDGTCANAARRFKRAGKEPKGRGPAYWKWLAKVQTPRSLKADKPVLGMPELVTALWQKQDTYIFYLTGREDVYRDVTEDWLDKWDFPRCPVVMRPLGNVQPNGEFKEDVIKDVAGIHSPVPVLVIDDDHTGEIDAVCKRNGWTFLKARSGS